jgi:hypothetical protein
LIAHALGRTKSEEEERLAAEGYLFCAETEVRAIGKLDAAKMAEVDDALEFSLGLK